MTIGKEDNGTTSIYTGGATGLLLFDSGSFSVNNLIMASKSGPNTGSGAKATATLTIGGGTFTVNGGPITLAAQTGAGVTGSANATLNLLGGTFRSGSDILTGPSNCTSTVNLDGGTLDMTRHAIGMNAQTVTVFNARSGTLMNLGEFNNGAPLVKTGGGTLTLDGTNTYAGATIVSNGILRLTGGVCLPPRPRNFTSRPAPSASSTTPESCSFMPSSSTANRKKALSTARRICRPSSPEQVPSSCLSKERCSG